MSLLLLGIILVVGAGLVWGQVVLDRRRKPTETHLAQDAAPLTSAPLPVLPEAEQPWYATFPRRLDALSIDAVVVLVFAAAMFAVMLLLEEHPPIPGILLIVLLVVAVFYEPVQVAHFGGTIGHRVMNLRVVDDDTGSNPTLLRAFIRVFAKGLLGIWAFVTMGRSRRHRAVHDMLTATTVQIRDRQRAQPHHYVLELPPRPEGGAA